MQPHGNGRPLHSFPCFWRPNSVAKMVFATSWTPNWIRTYSAETLGSDILAGLVVAVIVLPQSLAYAMLAGLPPQAGLYVSILPVIAYALIGSSMTQAIGPVAITAIMTYSILSPLAVPGSQRYLELAAGIALLHGIWVLALGLFRFGFLSSLLSRPVVAGFISGCAVLILLSQVKYVLGIEVQAGDPVIAFIDTLRGLQGVNAASTAIGFSGLMILLFARSPLARVLVATGLSKAHTDLLLRLLPIFAVAVATGAIVAFDLDRGDGVAVVGNIARGLPELGFNLPETAALHHLLLPSLSLAFIGIVQNITMAQALAMRRRERVNANHELIGLGTANIVAAVFGGMPVGGGMSRSAVNVAAGAQSPLASVVAAITILVLTLIGTSWFERIPLAILAANIVAAAIGMVDLSLLRRAWAYDKAEALAYVGTASSLLFFGLQFGIVFGVGLSLAALLYRMSNPHIAIVGRLPGTEHFRNTARHNVETIQDVLFLRIDEFLFFGNFGSVESRISAEISKYSNLHAVVLLMNAVNRIDISCVDGLADMCQTFSLQGIEVCFAEVKGPVEDRLRCTEFWPLISKRIYLSANDAFSHYAQKACAPSMSKLKRTAS